MNACGTPRGATASPPVPPARPVAWKVRGLPVKPVEVAVTVFAPAVLPSVQEPIVAVPFAAVVCERPVPEPPPEATANVTLTPATGLRVAVGDEHRRRRAHAGRDRGRLVVAARDRDGRRDVGESRLRGR